MAEPGFFSKEAGWARRKWLDQTLADVFAPVGDTLSYYAGPELTQTAKSAGRFLGMMNPINDVEQATLDGARMLAPGRTPGQRFSDGVSMITNVATVVAPVVAAKIGKVPADDLAEFVMDAFTGLGVKVNADEAAAYVKKFVANEDGSFPMDFVAPRNLKSSMSPPTPEEAAMLEAIDPQKAMSRKILTLAQTGQADDVTYDMLLGMDESYLNRIYDLPLDPGSRVARGQEMGFPVSLSDTGAVDIEDPLFHAKRGRPNIPVDEALSDPLLQFQGPGLDAGMPEKRPHGGWPEVSRFNTTFLTTDPDFADSWLNVNHLGTPQYDPGATTLKVTTNANRTWNPFNESHADAVRNAAHAANYRYMPGTQLNSELDRMVENTRRIGDWESIESPQHLKAMYDAGYDSFLTSERPIGTRYHSDLGDLFSEREEGWQSAVNLGVFDPSQIRAPTARFDPRFKNSRWLTMGVAPLAYSLGEALSTPEPDLKGPSGG